MLKYGLYARKSHDDPKLTAKSTGEQVAECRALAARDALSVAKVWEESRSAKVPGKRSHYDELIRLVERGKLDAILCWHVNRLARNMEEGGKLVQLLIDGRIREIRTPHAVYRAGENIMPIVIEAASATQFSIDLQNNVKRSMAGNFEAGGCNYKAPPGYRNVRDPLNLRRGLIEPDGDRFLVIRKFWELILSDSCSLLEALETLNTDWGFRIRATLNRPERPMRPNSAYSLLANPFYCGMVRHKGELRPGRHKAMVTVDEFDRVQRILRRRGGETKRRYFHAYTGLMRCGYCGQMVTAEIKRLRNGTHWETYRCADSWRRCTKRGIAADRVEKTIGEMLDSLNIDPEILREGLHAILDAIDRQCGAAEVLARNHANAAKIARERLERIDEMWVSGLLSDPARYQEMQRRERETLAELALRGERARAEDERMRRNARSAAAFLEAGPKMFKIAKDDVKKRIAEAFVSGYWFYGREKRIEAAVHPLLAGFIAFARTSRRLFEPLAGGFQNAIEPPLLGAAQYGGPHRAGIEPGDNPERNEGSAGEPVDLPPELLEALRGGEFAWDPREGWTRHRPSSH